MNKLWTVLAGLLLTFSASAQIEFEHSTWNEVLAKAKKENKTIFVDGYAVWCGPCKMMAKKVFTQPKVGDYYNEHFINVKMDLEKGEGKEFAKKYGVEGYPTLYFINGDGELVHKVLGGRMADDFLALGKSVADPKMSLPVLKKKYESGNYTDEDVKNYIEALSVAGDRSYTMIAEEYLEGKDLKTKENMAFLFKYSNPSKDSKVFSEVVNNRTEYINLLGEEKVIKKLYQAAFLDGRNTGLDFVDNAAVIKHFNQYLDAKNAKKYANTTYLQMLMYSKDDASKAKLYKDAPAILKNTDDFDSNFYNSIAWKYYEDVEDKKLLKDAVKWADISIEKEAGYYNLDTKAALLYKLGKKSDALKFAKKAIEYGKKDGADVSSTEELVEKINEL